MSDRVLIALSRDGLVRARVAELSGVAAEALIRHLPGMVGAIALSRGLSTAAVFPVSWKDSERINIQWSGAGPLGTVLVEHRAPGCLRGLVTNASVIAREGFEPARAIGPYILPRAYVSVLRQAKNGTVTRGQVLLTNGELDRDLEHWFESSEQVATRLRSYVEIGRDGLSVRASALFVQLMPNGSPDLLPDPVALDHLTVPASEDALLAAAFGGRPFDLVDSHPLEYSCSCSRERIEAAIGILSAEELEDMIAKDDGARARCDFCATDYVFSADDLRDVLRRKEDTAE